MTKVGRVIADKYELREQIGEGAHGMVYRARHLDLGRDVAIKLLKPEVSRDDPTLQKRFLREVHLATSFVHRYAITLRDFGRDGGLLYYTMDYVLGPTLRKVLNHEESLPLKRALPIATQILEALAEAHRVGVIHRDLKPSNILLTEGPEGEEVRVLDFGLAKAVRQSQGEETTFTDLTVAGARVGTLAYMSPEQAMGRELDARSDVYAVGGLLYLLLSGSKPCFPRRDVADPLQAFLFNLTTRRPTDLRELAPEVPRSVAEVVMRSLAKKPSERFADARSFRSTLLKALKHEASKASPRSGERAKLRRKATRPASELGSSPSSKGASSKGASSKGASSKGASSKGASKKRAYKLPAGVVHGSGKGEFLNERDGSLLVYVPPGNLRMGAMRRAPSARGLELPRRRQALGREDPVHFVHLTKGFFLGKTPVTWKQYRAFCVETGRKPPRTISFPRLRGFDITDSHPAVSLRWKDARAYCHWAHGRLPSEAEWELAARGDDSRTYPWGEDELDHGLANWGEHPIYGGKATSPAGSFPRGHSPYGALDMIGNVWEWTGDLFGDYPAEAQTDPSGPRGSRRSRQDRVARGGSWRDPASFCRATARMGVPPSDRHNWLGFRLCVPAL